MDKIDEKSFLITSFIVILSFLSLIWYKIRKDRKLHYHKKGGE